MLFRVVYSVGISEFFNVESVKAFIMNSSKRQTTPWTKSRKKLGPKKKEKGEHFDESKKKELAASDKGSWFDQPSSDVSGVSRVSHPSTSREVGARSLKLMVSKAFTSGLAESDSTSGDESNGSTESEELECEDEPNTWTVVDRERKSGKSIDQEIASCRSCGNGVRLRLQNFSRIQWAIFVASRSRRPNLVFHWSAA